MRKSNRQAPAEKLGWNNQDAGAKITIVVAVAAVLASIFSASFELHLTGIESIR